MLSCDDIIITTTTATTTTTTKKIPCEGYYFRGDHKDI